MPKRKAIGPVENSSDGEEEEFYSFPPTPIQSAPSKPTFYNNLHIPSSVKRNISSGPGGSFGIGGGGGSFMQKATQGTKPFFGLSTSNQSPLKPTVVTTSTGPVAAKKPRSQEFLRNMKDLNKAFATSVRKSVSKNPSHSVIPLVKDYLYHSRVLMEQLKKGDNPGELVNGVDSPSRSFKSLGEFFDDFEQRFTEQSCSRESRNNSGESCLRSALTNSDNSSTLSSATSGASSSSFNSNASPSPTKPTAAAAADNLIKSVNSFPTFDASPFKPTPFTMGTSKTSTNLDIKAKEVTSFVPSSSPIAAAAASPLQKFKPATTLSSAATASTSSPAKPAGVFSGFSFFTSPTPGNPSLKFGSTSATVTSEKPEEKNNDEDDAEDEEPPKVEVTQVTEDDAVYSIRYFAILSHQSISF